MHSAIESAVQELREHPEKSVRQVARERNVPKSTLHDRWTNTHASHADGAERHLSCVQEDALVDKINEYASRGTLLTPRHVHDLAEAVCGEQIGENWVGRFVDRHSDRISSRFHTYRELARLQADCQEVRRAWFSLVSVTTATPSTTYARDQHLSRERHVTYLGLENLDEGVDVE